MMFRHPLARRTFLHGAGVTMGLPWMESLAARDSDAPQTPPRRFAALFMANGVNFPNWWAEGAGDDLRFGRCLRPLEPWRTKVNVINGLFNRNATGVGIHPGQTGNLLSGASLQRGSVLQGGISVDQMLARHLGKDTIQSSLVLGCEEPVTGYHETNFSMVYSSHISWRDRSAPVPMEVYPSLAFDSLFDNSGSRRMESILDRVSEHASLLRRHISEGDRVRLDEYLTSVREVEQRSQRMRKAQQAAAERSRLRGQPLITMDRPENGMPEDIREHMRLMCDIIALAFQTDRTRVATLLMCRDISGLVYPFLNVRVGHHGASHRDEGDEYERITTWYVSQYASLIDRLQNMPEGDSTVLDNSCLMFINNLWSGKAHDSSRVPVVLAGGLGGTLQTGRVLDYLPRGDDERKLCSLYLSLMDRMGVRVDRFGDADSRLAGL